MILAARGTKVRSAEAIDCRQCGLNASSVMLAYEFWSKRQYPSIGRIKEKGPVKFALTLSVNASTYLELEPGPLEYFRYRTQL